MTDTRDLRDPQELGRKIRQGRVKSSRPASVVADWAEREEVPNYPQDESMCVLTKREYREELEARAAEGDRYAASALEQLNKGERVSNDDPAGT